MQKSTPFKALPKWLSMIQRRSSALLHDVLMVPLAWFLAYAMRFNFEEIPADFYQAAWAALPIVWGLQIVSFWFFGLYKGVWRFASVPDLLRIAKSVLTGVAAIALILFLIQRMEGVPRAVLPLYVLNLAFMLGGSRMFYRWLKDHKLRVPVGQRILVVGAGDAAEGLLRELFRQRPPEYQVIGLIDDNPKKFGREIHNVQVVGNTDALPELVRQLQIELIVLAIPSATREQWRRIVSLCESAGVPFRTVPSMADIVSGKMTMDALREVSIDDLLRRDVTKFNAEPITDLLAGQVVLVTGAGGSIGSQLALQISKHSPKILYLLDQAETPLAQVYARLGTFCTAVPVLMDITQNDLVHETFKKLKPNLVFHAAAYKHVPLLEKQKRVAIENNVLGTDVILRASHKCNVSKLVVISTDKAVEPSNIMGATKRVGERLVLAKSTESDLCTAVVRFGNVLDSAGSVLPLFRQQIRDGGPVTVTHPDMERFFMTIPEACQLILHAAQMANGREVFVLDMGKPVRIVDMAEQMIRLSGLEPGKDIEISFTQPRPGEKLTERLFFDFEQPEPTANPQIQTTHSEQEGLSNPDEAIAKLKLLLRQGDEASLTQWLVSYGGYRPESSLDQLNSA